MKKLLLATALALAPLASVQAAPADNAAAVSAPGRPEAAVQLDANRKPAELLSFGGLQRGAHALDLFTGSGYFAEIMGRAVGPRGHVVAWQPANFVNERSRAGLEALRQRTPNVAWFQTSANALALPTAAFDFVMINLNYHDTYWQSTQFRLPRMDPDAILRTLFQAVKPGGVVLVVDHVANPGRDTRAEVEATHRILPETVRADFERAGFVLDGESDLLRNPQDDHSKNVFDPGIRGGTDRFVYRFRRPLRAR